jgi:hypothetical protein
MLLVEQNANIALTTAHYGYVLEVGRIVHGGHLRSACCRRRTSASSTSACSPMRCAARALEEEEAVALSPRTIKHDGDKSDDGHGCGACDDLRPPDASLRCVAGRDDRPEVLECA